MFLYIYTTSYFFFFLSTYNINLNKSSMYSSKRRYRFHKNTGNFAFSFCMSYFAYFLIVRFHRTRIHQTMSIVLFVLSIVKQAVWDVYPNYIGYFCLIITLSWCKIVIIVSSPKHSELFFSQTTW